MHDSAVRDRHERDSASTSKGRVVGDVGSPRQGNGPHDVGTCVHEADVMAPGSVGGCNGREGIPAVEEHRNTGAACFRWWRGRIKVAGTTGKGSHLAQSSRRAAGACQLR
jgi:hypothetical protein